MSNLVDFQIRALCRESGLVEPFDSEMINPASIDVTLGNIIQSEGLICGPKHLRTRWIEHHLQDDDEYILTPGAFILAHTKRIIHYHVDYVKSNFWKSKKLTAMDQQYWIAHGVDQLAHLLTYIGIIYILCELNLI